MRKPPGMMRDDWKHIWKAFDELCALQMNAQSSGYTTWDDQHFLLRDILKVREFTFTSAQWKKLNDAFAEWYDEDGTYYSWKQQQNWLQAYIDSMLREQDK